LSTQPSLGNALDEWKEARSVIARFDNNIHDLRKYGFSFVTALLAANGLLSQGGTSVVPVEVKAAILVATMGLIVTLKLLDTHYRLFQKAASMRCRILENRLNLDITNDISFFYDLGYLHHWMYVQFLYYGFVTLTVMLGLAILWSNTNLIILMLLSALVSYVLIYLTYRQKPTALEDWSVDNKIVGQGTSVRITYTNLNSQDSYRAGVFRLSWNIKKESATTAAASEPDAPPVDVPLLYFQSKDWLWKTEKVEPGLYELEMLSARVQSKGREASTTAAASIGTRAISITGARKPPPLTIQVTPKAKQEEPVRVVLEKTGHS
jgi:hypothetical protein